MNWDLTGALGDLESSGLRRRLRVLEPAANHRILCEGRTLHNFASNDYLGLADSSFLRATLAAAVQAWGAGAGASRLVTGTTRAHAELEAALAEFKGTEAALSFASGHATAMGTLPALLGPGDTILLDKLSHACLVDAARLSGATIRVFPHNHLGKLERLLAGARGRVLNVTDAVFSMDGDLAPLPELLELAERFDAWLVVDDAHGFGVLGPNGRGSLAHFGLPPSPRLVLMGTLGKAAGVSGAFVAGDARVIEWLMQRARPYIFTTASSPAIAAALATSLELIAAGDNRRAHLQRLIARLREGLSDLPWRLLPSLTAIQPLIVGENQAVLALAERLWARQLWVPAIRPPTVPSGTARLRISLSAAHTVEQIDALLAALRECATPPC